MKGLTGAENFPPQFFPGLGFKGNSERGLKQHNSCVMGWITEEYSRRPAAQPSQASDQARQHAVANLWLELREGILFPPYPSSAETFATLKP